MSAARGLLGHPMVVLACRLLIGAIFVFSGLAKIGDLGTFAGDVHNFRMVPVALEHVIAMALPWVELVVGLALVSGVRARAGAVISFALMLLFTVAVAQAIVRGLDIECGCFGKENATRVGWVKLAQNVGLTIAAALASRRR